MRILAAILLLLSSLAVGQGATQTAASASRADVGTAYTACSNGDTLVIPAGTATWTSKLDVAKAITIQGAGIGSTIIRDGGTAYGDPLFNITLQAGLNTRVTGIEFNDSGSASGNGAGVFIVYGTNIDARRIRIDHCKFDQLWRKVITCETALGVVDHNTIIGRAGGEQVFISFTYGRAWGTSGGSGVDNWGDASWAAAENFGSDEFLFFEDNTITNLYSFNLTGIDGHSGGRYVSRYNSITGANMEQHGPEGERTRGGRCYEIYNNTFTGIAGGTPLYMRGGSGVVHNNTFTNYGAVGLNLLYFRLSSSTAFNPFGGADGRNPWDVNHGSNPFATGTCSSATALTMTDSGKSWTTNQWAGYILRKTSGKAISSASRSVATCTVSCTGHGFSTGNIVSIFNSSTVGWNRVTSITVTDANTFTFSDNLLGIPTPAAGTMYACLGSWYAIIDSNTATRLTFATEGHGSPYDMTFAAATTYEINRVTQGMDQIGAGAGSNLNGVNVPTIPGGWPNQTTSPWYEWNNTREAGANVDFSTLTGATDYGKTVLLGTHFFNDTAKPGYTPYTYPHPLTGVVAPSGGSVTFGAGAGTATFGSGAGTVSFQ